MTGHQENPGSGKTLSGEDTAQANIAEIARALGVKRVVEIKCDNIVEIEKVLKEELDADELSVVVAKGPCVISAKLTVGAKPHKVISDACKICGMCFKVGCPAITRGESVG